MLGLLSELSALATVADAVSGGAPGTIAFGNNSISVNGGGNDTIFGNIGEYLVPWCRLRRGVRARSSTNAIALDTYLLEMQEVFGDMSFVVHEAGSRVVGSYTGPASHLLDIENNTINASGNSGSDLIAGNTGIVVIPGDNAASTSNWATGVSSSTLQSVASQLQSLESNFDGDAAATNSPP